MTHFKISLLMAQANLSRPNLSDEMIFNDGF
jgi:hypothetical protein